MACGAPSTELLLVHWLNAVVLRMATDNLVFGAFEVAISGTRLDGRARGRRYRASPARGRGQGRNADGALGGQAAG